MVPFVRRGRIRFVASLWYDASRGRQVGETSLNVQGTIIMMGHVGSVAMPLMDHFRPPLYPARHWESFQVTWAVTMADALNQSLLPEGYFAEEHAHAGSRVEIDVATFADETFDATAPRNGSLATKSYAPPTPPLIVPAAFPDEFEVRVFEMSGGYRLVAAIELVSPANKDRKRHRRAFALKCAGYLSQGISLIVVDAVTTRQANLHEEILRVLEEESETGLQDGTDLYAVSYRPIVQEGREDIHVWPSPLAIGEELPTLPLALNAEICVPLDLEATYSAARDRRRWPG